VASLEVLEQKLAGIWDHLSPEDRAAVDRLLVDHCEDPLKRLLDPGFTEVSWDYQHSRIDSPLPGKLHAKQVEAMQAMGTHKHSFLFWGNQVGKTTWAAIMVVLAALGRHPYLKKWEPPIVCWASALSWELWEKVLLPEILTWIPPSRLLSAPPSMKRSTNRDIFIKADNGRTSRITGKAAEQGADKYQSARVHIVWTDEEHPEAVWDEMQPRLLRHGGITINSMTPIKGITWVHSRIYEPWKRGERPDIFVSHAGLKDNPSITPAEIQAITRELSNNPSMLAARLFGLFVRPIGLVLKPIPVRDLGVTKKEELEAARALVRRGAVVGGVDFGLHRFAFVLAAADSSKELVLLAEYFSQGESLKVRAEEIDRILTRLEVKPHQVRLVGDCANPTDILELNLAFAAIKSEFRVAAVMGELKIIKAGILRILGLLAEGKLTRSARLGEDLQWHEGRTAEKPGRPVMGSRLLWELNNWRWPKTTELKPEQRDVPDDHSADGADMMAALRYLVMAWWFEAGAEDPSERTEDHFHHEDSKPGGGELPRELRRDATDTPRRGILGREPRKNHGLRDVLPRYRVPHQYDNPDPDEDD
jgi:phage terminase large subunit-like protein